MIFAVIFVIEMLPRSAIEKKYDPYIYKNS